MGLGARATILVSCPTRCRRFVASSSCVAHLLSNRIWSGELDYDYAGNDSHTAARSDNEPRYPESGVEDITQGMENLTAQPDPYDGMTNLDDLGKPHI